MSAAKAFEAVLESDPKSIDALRGLAALAVEREDLDKALDLQAKLIEAGERTPELFYNTGLLLQKSGQVEDAIRLYQEALAERPQLRRSAAQPGPRPEGARASRMKPATAGARRWNRSPSWQPDISNTKSPPKLNQQRSSSIANQRAAGFISCRVCFLYPHFPSPRHPEPRSACGTCFSAASCLPTSRPAILARQGETPCPNI